jgi:hypothetical protein
MSKPKLEEMDFGARPDFLRLTLACLIFSFLGYLFYLDTVSRLKDTPVTDPQLVVEKVTVSLFLLATFGFIVSYALLPQRLKFTEEGVIRRTLLPPRFIPWVAVRRAQIGSYKGYYALELWVSGWRWVCVPLLQYKKGASLLDEVRWRLPVEVVASERQLARLSDR